MATIRGASDLKCSFTIPDPSQNLQDTVSRWAATSLEPPAIIIYPVAESDIVTAIAVAKQNGLQLLPVGGTHGSFVSVTPRTMYLDMKNFRAISLDKTAKTVTFGGGVTAGEVIRAVAAEGYYTPIPDSNAVGMVGSLLGGGTSHLTGLHGFMADNAVSFRIVTADGQILIISSSSSGEELALFNALCGAGHGLGVVTAATSKIYPIADLGLAEDKVWTHTSIFPPPRLEDITFAFLALQPVKAPLVSQLAFLRSPPGQHNPEEPLVVLSISYFGPSHEAEAAAAPLLDPLLLKKALHHETVLKPLASLNDELDPVNVHNGLKTMTAARLLTHQAPSITASFQKWLKVTEEFDDAKGTVVVFTAQSMAKALENGQDAEIESRLVKSDCRKKGAIVMASTWCFSPTSHEALSGFGKEVIEVNRSFQPVASSTLPNNMTTETTMEEMFSRDQINSLARLKKAWDVESIFWSPYWS